MHLKKQYIHYSVSDCVNWEELQLAAEIQMTTYVKL